MQKQEIDMLVESFFNPQSKKEDNQMSFDDLIAIINEVKTTLPALVLEAGPRMNLGGPPLETPRMGAATPKSISWDSIPEISVTELGWASLNTTDTGEMISGPARQRLEQYLSNIQGQTFTEKIQGISDLFNMDEEQIKNAQFLTGATNADKIQKTLAYLVFLKTLTTIITNFNAASAGFTFEAFLAVLLGGKQQSTGGGTIADLYTGDGIPISLKLYAEDGLTVGGSFTDLVGDMVSPKTDKHLIRYIVVTKALSGKGLDKEGQIKFYQFDIDLNSIADDMMLSENGELMMLPISFLQDAENTDFSSFKKVKATINQEQLANVFLNALTELYGEEIGKEIYDETMNAGQLNIKNVNPPKAISDSVPDIIASKTNKELNPEQKAIAKANYKVAYTKAKEYADNIKGSDTKDEKDEKLKQIQFADKQQSYEAYKSFSPEMKKKALINSYGYLHTEQFEMTKNQMFSVMQKKKLGRRGTASEPIGTIKVGSKNLQDIMNKLAINLNEAIFEIFNNLSILTRTLNSYFATGLRDQTAADQAQTAAQNIDKKTAEIKQAR
jgi:hypothetical protein